MCSSICPDVAHSNVRLEEDERWAESVEARFRQQIDMRAVPQEKTEPMLVEQDRGQMDELLQLTIRKHPEIVRTCLLNDSTTDTLDSSIHRIIDPSIHRFILKLWFIKRTDLLELTL